MDQSRDQRDEKKIGRRSAIAGGVLAPFALRGGPPEQDPKIKSSEDWIRELKQRAEAMERELEALRADVYGEKKSRTAGDADARKERAALGKRLTGVHESLTQAGRERDESIGGLMGRVQSLEGKDAAAIGSIVVHVAHRAKIPRGWRLCDGSPMKIRGRANDDDVAPELHAVIGTLHGKGVDPDSRRKVAGFDFNLPDLRGVFLRAADDGADIDPDGSRPMGSKQPYSTARPRNDFLTAEDGGHHHQIKSNGIGAGCRGDGIGDTRTGHNHWMNVQGDGKHAHVVNRGGDAETRPVNRAVRYIIKVR